MENECVGEEVFILYNETFQYLKLKPPTQKSLCKPNFVFTNNGNLGLMHLISIYLFRFSDYS